MEYGVIDAVISQLCAHYETSDSWGTPPTVVLSLCWKTLEEAYQLFDPTTVSLDVMHKWCSENQRAISLLATVYNKMHDVTLLQCIPDVVKQSGDDHMKKYFEWVMNMQKVISSWQQKVHANEWTEADVKQYAEVMSSVNRISTDLCIEVLEAADIESMQKAIHELKQVVKNALMPVHAKER